jgi:hypothetical protein
MPTGQREADRALTGIIPVIPASGVIPAKRSAERESSRKLERPSLDLDSR